MRLLVRHLLGDVDDSRSGGQALLAALDTAENASIIVIQVVDPVELVAIDMVGGQVEQAMRERAGGSRVAAVWPTARAVEAGRVPDGRLRWRSCRPSRHRLELPGENHVDRLLIGTPARLAISGFAPAASANPWPVAPG